MTPLAGSAFKVCAEPYHVYITVTSPDDRGCVVIVNLTSLYDSTEDTACVLSVSDYPEYLKKPTTVAYGRAIHVLARTLQNPSHFRPIQPVPQATLRKIMEGALKSDSMPGKL